MLTDLRRGTIQRVERIAVVSPNEACGCSHSEGQPFAGKLHPGPVEPRGRHAGGDVRGQSLAAMQVREPARADSVAQEDEVVLFEPVGRSVPPDSHVQARHVAQFDEHVVQPFARRGRIAGERPGSRLVIVLGGLGQVVLAHEQSG